VEAAALLVTASKRTGVTGSNACIRRQLFALTMSLRGCRRACNRISPSLQRAVKRSRCWKPTVAARLQARGPYGCRTPNTPLSSSALRCLQELSARHVSPPPWPSPKQINIKRQRAQTCCRPLLPYTYRDLVLVRAQSQTRTAFFPYFLNELKPVRLMPQQAIVVYLG